jgi:hypothetical protein
MPTEQSQIYFDSPEVGGQVAQEWDDLKEATLTSSGPTPETVASSQTSLIFSLSSALMLGRAVATSSMTARHSLRRS